MSYHSLKNRCGLSAFVIFALVIVTSAHAAGMIPETSVVLISAADGEGVISVKNTDAEAVLLYTSLENLPEDQENFILVTPPIMRVEAGDKQMVRFILQSPSAITTQRLKRVTFEGVPQKDPSKPSKIGVTVRQNLPVLITPSNLPAKSDPWTLLQLTLSGKTLTLKNDSRYVVRLNLALDLLPAVTRLSLKKTYLLPGSSQVIDLPDSIPAQGVTGVRLFPVSVYGYQVKPYDAVLSH